MANLIPFLRARLAERSSRIQLYVLVLLALVLTGALTIEQIQASADKILAAMAVLGPMVGLLVPDYNHEVGKAASQDAAIDAAVVLATKAAENAAGPEATKVAKAVSAVVDKIGL